MSNKSITRRIRVGIGISPGEKTRNKIMIVAPGLVLQSQQHTESAIWELSSPRMSLPHAHTESSVETWHVQVGISSYQKTRDKLLMVALCFVYFIPQDQQYAKKFALGKLSYQASPKMSPQSAYAMESPVETTTTLTTEIALTTETAEITENLTTSTLPQDPQHQIPELHSELHPEPHPEAELPQPLDPLHQTTQINQINEPLPTPTVLSIAFVPPPQPDTPLPVALEAPLPTPLPVPSIPLASTPLAPPDSDMQLMEPWSQELLEQYAALPLPPFYDVLVQQEKVASEIRKQNVCLQNVYQHAQQCTGGTLTALSGIQDMLANLDNDISGIKTSVQSVYHFLQEKWKSIDEDVVNEEEVDDYEIQSDDYEIQEELQDEEQEDTTNPYSFSPRFATASATSSRTGDHQDKRLIQLLESVEKRLASSISPEQCLIEAMDAVFQLLQATEKMANDIMSIVPFTTGFLKYSKPNWRIQLEKILQSHLEGLEIVRDKLFKSLEETGITLIAPEDGAPFDPKLHTAMERVPTSDPEYIGQVAQLICYGYIKDNAPLRYATVAVYCR